MRTSWDHFLLYGQSEGGDKLANAWTCGKVEDETFTTYGCGVLIFLLFVVWELLAE